MPTTAAVAESVTQLGQTLWRSLSRVAKALAPLGLEADDALPLTNQQAQQQQLPETADAQLLSELGESLKRNGVCGAWKGGASGPQP
jgi:hypothetical protein